MKGLVMKKCAGRWNFFCGCIGGVLLAGVLQPAAAAEPGRLLIDGSRGQPVEAAFVRQHFVQPWVLEGLRRGPARIRQRLLLTAPGATADAPLARITPLPSPGGNNAPDYLVQTGDCRIFTAVSGRLADAADQMRFACPEAPDVQHIARQRSVCAAQGGTWEISMMYPDGKCLPDSRARCTERGGTWKRVSWTQELLCVEQTPDGGRSCTDGAQCAARICLHDGPDNTRPNGKCPNTYGPTLGCFTQIKNGMLQPTLCVD